MTTGVRLWPGDLDASDTAVLGRDDGAHRRCPDVLVVGGGIVGVAIAWALESAGVGEVQLVEAGELGSGSTGGAAGLLTPEPHHGTDPAPFVELGRESLVRWRELDAGVPGGLGLVDLVWLGLLSPGEDASRRSPKGEVLEAHAVRRLVPGLASPVKALRIDGQARVNPLRAVARLGAQLRHVATGVQVTGAVVRHGRITSVETNAGPLSPGAVVFATGNPPVLRGLEVAVPADHVRGHILVTEPVAVRFPGTVDPLATQLADGRLLVGGTLDTGKQDPEVDPVTLRQLLDGLARWIPAFQGLRAGHAWCCFRPHHPDDMPTIDRVPGLEGAWFTSGHYRTGILMAPATAAILAEWLVSGVAPDRAAPFGFERLS